MISSNSRKWATAGLCLVLGYSLIPGLAYASKKGRNIKQLYDQASSEFRGPTFVVDDACTKFTEIFEQNPHYRRVKGMMKAACEDARTLREDVMNDFMDGSKDLKAGNYDNAWQVFVGARKQASSLKNPPHSISEIENALDDVEKRYWDQEQAAVASGEYGKAKTALEGAKSLLNAAKLSRPAYTLDQIEREELNVNMRAASAQQQELARAAEISSEAPPATPASKVPGTSAKGPGNTTQAKNVAPVSPPRKNGKLATGMPPRSQTEGAPSETAGENSNEQQQLHEGLVDFFDGDYESARRYLTEYLREGRGQKRLIAFFFRGAALESQYLLATGERDERMQQEALQDFRRSRGHYREFPLIDKVKPRVSPRIIEAYSRLAR